MIKEKVQKATDAYVKRGIGLGCDAAANRSMRNADFNPALDAEGNPVAATHTVTIIFEL